MSSKPSSNPEYIARIRSWIDACDTLHSHVCVPKPVSQRQPEDVPTWLIDSHQQRIVPGIAAHRYLALSYVWPETRDATYSILAPPRTLLLDNETVANFRTPGFLGSENVTQRIPMIIHHAMELTQALGERYLWVDRLCIIQNDLGDGGTLSQVAKMDKIYSGAYLTIIAAAPEEMYTNGLAREWPLFDTVRSKSKNTDSSTRPQENDGEGSNRASTFPEMSEEEVNAAVRIRYGKLSRSKWATRGWTYQEQILCKRAVVFVLDGLFWDCQCCVWDGVDLLPGKYFPNLELHAKMGQRLTARRWPDFGFYVDLICPYNGRHLSYPQDALLGFLSILGVLTKSFAGGFIHGLPRLFLDHAILWQPFGVAERRVDRADDDTVHSSLPSWSWCGWQVFVDPWSLRSGFAYIDDDRASSWRTRNLVEWYLSTEDQISERICEPRMLERCIEAAAGAELNLPDEWTRQEVSDMVFFTHAADRSVRFRHPIPLVEHSPGQCLLSTPAYLTCSTTTASFFAATVLKPKRDFEITILAPPKRSAFDDDIFKLGPRIGKHCRILVLQQPNGAFAGLLRLMRKDKVDETTSFELIAVSTGSVHARDLRKSLEWKIFENGFTQYGDGWLRETIDYLPDWISEKGRYALLYNAFMAFNKISARKKPWKRKLDRILAEIESCVNEDIIVPDKTLFVSPAAEQLKLEKWFQTRREFRDDIEHLIGRQPDDPDEDFVCEFYNVLWFERREGIAYRRACGWVPKHVWETHSRGLKEIKMG